MKAWLFAAAALSLLGSITVAAAQTPLPPVRPPDEARTPEPSATAPALQDKVDQLAETIGTLTYLRDLCGYGDGSLWRSKMNDLLAAEPADGERRERLAGAFNRGFRNYQITYRTCTAMAQLIIDRALASGGKLSHELSRRFTE